MIDLNCLSLWHPSTPYSTTYMLSHAVSHFQRSSRKRRKEALRECPSYLVPPLIIVCLRVPSNTCTIYASTCLHISPCTVFSTVWPSSGRS